MDGKPHENGNTVRGLESWVEESRIPKRKRVQAPAALSFYRSCADAPNDGFCPQSGPVQREFYSIAAAGSGILESKRGAPALGGQGLSSALSRGLRVV